MSYEDIWTARPSRPPASRGEYTPPRPFLRPGSHPNAPPKEEPTVTSIPNAVFSELSMKGRRQWLREYLGEHGPSRRRDVMAAAGCDEKYLDPVVSDMRKAGQLETVEDERGVKRWQLVDAGGGREGEAGDEIQGDGSGANLPPVSDDEQIAEDEAAIDRAASAGLRAFRPPADDEATGGGVIPSEGLFGPHARPPEPGTIQEIRSSIERVAVSGDGCLMLWTRGQLIELDNHETRQLLKLLQTNQRVIESA